MKEEDRGQMADEEEFEEWISPLRNKMLKKTDTFYWAKQAWLEKGRRDRRGLRS